MAKRYGGTTSYSYTVLLYMTPSNVAIATFNRIIYLHSQWEGLAFQVPQPTYIILEYAYMGPSSYSCSLMTSIKFPLTTCKIS